MEKDWNFRNNNYGDTKKSNEHTSNSSNLNNITTDDLKKLKLLNIQKNVQIISIISDILSYESTLEGIEIIYNKYSENPQRMPNPDIPALKASYLALITQLVVTQIGFIRYEDLYEKKVRGEIDYSIEPNEYINIGNVFGIAANYYSLIGIKGIYERDGNQPIFGV